MTESFYNQLKSYFANEGLHTNKFKGGSEAEINALKQQQSVEFIPRVYSDFLLFMGRGTEKLGIMADFYWTLSDLPDLKREALSILIGAGHGQRIPTDALVFLTRNGEAFSYFCTSTQVDDPPVITFATDDEFHEHGLLSTFLLNLIDSYIHPGKYRSTGRNRPK